MPHPIKDLEHVERLAQAVERLVETMALEQARLSELVTLETGLAENGILWSGAVSVGPDAATHRSGFRAPFACLYVADLAGVGPIYVANDTAELVVSPEPGPGRWMVPVGKAEVIPLTGQELSLSSTSAGLCYLTVFAKAAAPTLGGH